MNFIKIPAEQLDQDLGLKLFCKENEEMDEYDK